MLCLPNSNGRGIVRGCWRPLKRTITPTTVSPGLTFAFYLGSGIDSRPHHSEFKEAFPAGRFRPVCKIQAKRGASSAAVADSIKPPEWWHSTRIIQAFDGVLQDKVCRKALSIGGIVVDSVAHHSSRSRLS